MNSIKMLAACAIAGLMAIAAAPAGADVQRNGGKLNGGKFNGISVNGGKINGISVNGLSMQSANSETPTSATELANDSFLPIRAQGGRLVIQPEQK